MNIKHENILIREATSDDAVQLCEWWNDGKVMAHAGFPNGLGTTPEKIIGKLGDGNSRHMIIYDDIPIGEMNYRDVGDKTCEIGIKICRDDMREMGIGKNVLSLFIRELFTSLGYHRIILDTNLKNLRAQHVYERLGFRKIRIRRDSWRDQLGELQSAVDYELEPCDFISFI